MSTTNIPVPAKTWTQLTTTDKTGAIYHKSGDNKIVYVEAESTPADFTGSSPVMEITSKHEQFVYFNTPALDLVWAWSETDAIVSVTPSGI